MAAITLQLGVAARELTHHMSHDEMTPGGLVNGIQVDPVTYLLSHLASQFAPLGEETRLVAMTELMMSQRQPNENIDTLLRRFTTLRHRA